MTDEEKKSTDHLNCMFYGDFALDHNPASFKEAMEIYAKLPTKLGNGGELAVPIQVWLYPLTHLNSQAAQLLQDISVALVSKSQEVLEEIDEHIMRCNDIMKDSVVNDFPEIRKTTDQFKSMLNLFKCIFQRDLARVFPSIRGHGASEEELADILKKKEESPFKRWAITTWLDKREKEITMLRSFFNQIKKRNLNIVINDLDELLYNTSINNIVCLTFTSLHVCQPYMSEMESYLQAHSRESLDKSSELSEELIIEKFRQHSQSFIEFAEINQNNETMRFLVHSKPDADYLGATIYLYQSGQLKNRDFHIPSKPEPLVVDSQTLIAITLKLRPLKSDSEGYRVEYKRTEDKEWETVDTSDKNENVTITKLLPGSTYQLRHRAVCQVGVSQASNTIEVKIPSAKHHAAKLAIKQKCQGIKDGNHKLYLLRLKSEFINTVKKIRKCTFGEITFNKPRKTIMVLGATGSGKSTLINRMVNYILGVEWEDDFRFKLIYEETSRSQAESQTSAVTAYEMNYQDCFKVPCSFTIVDTPGFGDTRGIQEDRKRIDQIAEYLSSTNTFQHIDAVCFVVQDSEAELTQKYVFDFVLSIFGKDIANNILVFITFADGQRPPVLDAIMKSNIPFPKDDKGSPLFFRFNNSVLFNNNDETNSSDDQMLDKIFWDMGTKSMEKLFMSLVKMDSTMLGLTKEVLKERRRLATAVEGLEPQIKAGLNKLEEIRQTRDILNKHITDMESNKDYEYEVEEIVTKRESIAGTGKFITNCQKCNFTCHYPCKSAGDKDKIRCSVMKDGVCTVCPGRCVWNVHSNQQHRFIYETKKVKMTYDELKKKSEKAKGEKMTTEHVLKQLQHELDVVEQEVQKLIEGPHKCIKRLKEIALGPNPLFTPEYIDLLIQSEEQEAQPGWMERVKALQEVKEQAVIIEKVSRNEKLLPGE
uniref:Fibronectin type-III domain-containing protein n=2 Tax=Erpetoichthys calabaricus TaxID=27687 RepID=A0A8C4TJ60_ERPCA